MNVLLTGYLIELVNSSLYAFIRFFDLWCEVLLWASNFWRLTGTLAEKTTNLVKCRCLYVKFTAHLLRHSWLNSCLYLCPEYFGLLIAFRDHSSITQTAFTARLQRHDFIYFRVEYIPHTACLMRAWGLVLLHSVKIGNVSGIMTPRRANWLIIEQGFSGYFAGRLLYKKGVVTRRRSRRVHWLIIEQKFDVSSGELLCLLFGVNADCTMLFWSFRWREYLSWGCREVLLSVNFFVWLGDNYSPRRCFICALAPYGRNVRAVCHYWKAECFLFILY